LLEKVGSMLTSATAAASTSAAATAVTSSATTTEAVATHVGQLRGDLLLGLTQDIKQISSLLIVVGREEGNGGTRSTKECQLSPQKRKRLGGYTPSTTGTSDTMDVIL
jgi:hypothetical protein